MKYLLLRPFTALKSGEGPDARQLAGLAKSATVGTLILAMAYFTCVLLLARR
jgi:hypothetical protein